MESEPIKNRKHRPHTRPNRLPSIPGGGKQHNIYLDETTVNNAKLIGSGNLSAGIRTAVKICTEMKSNGQNNEN